MRKNIVIILLVLGVAAFAVGAAFTTGGHKMTHPGYSLAVAAAPFNDHTTGSGDPPECKNGTIASGNTTYYVQWCGTGPDGEYPIKWWATVIIDDGGGLTLQCGQTVADRCVFLAPLSPSS